MNNAPPLGAGFEARYDGTDGYLDDSGAESPSLHRNDTADADAPGGEQPPPQPDRDMPAAVIKILVTNNVAGGLIGKKGQMINDMQAQSGARIKLSQTNDFFPGTQERTVLISGEQAEVMHAQELVLQRIQADPWIQPDTPVPQHLLPHPPPPPPELSHPGVSLDGIVDYGNAADYSGAAADYGGAAAATAAAAAAVGYAMPPPLLPPPGSPLVTDIMLVRIVIPAPAAGAVIGRQGARINQLKDETGAHIRLVRKEESAVPNERLVNIQGTLAACCQVVNVVIARMGEEPEELGCYHNMTTSYSRMLAGLLQHHNTANTYAQSHHEHYGNSNSHHYHRGGGRYRQPQQQHHLQQYHRDGSSSGYSQQQHHSGAANSGNMMPYMKANHYHQPHLHLQHQHLPTPPPSLHYPPPYSHGGAPSPMAIPHVMPHAVPYGNPGRFAAHPSQPPHLHHPAAAAAAAVGMWQPYFSHLPLMPQPPSPSSPGAAGGGGDYGEEAGGEDGQRRSVEYAGSNDGNHNHSGSSRSPASPEEEENAEGSNGEYSPMVPPGAGLNYQQQVGMVQLAVADWMVPCLLGTKGATLRELMAYSRATIKVSQRDEMIPGTMNRIVTCTGSPQATQAAQFLIQQRIQMAQQQQGLHHHQQQQQQQQLPLPPQAVPPPLPSAAYSSKGGNGHGVTNNDEDN